MIGRQGLGLQSLVGVSARVVWGLAAHVGILDLHAEQRAVGAHAQLVALHALVEVDVARRVGDARGVEHDRAVQHDAVLLRARTTFTFYVRRSSEAAASRVLAWRDRVRLDLRLWAQCHRPFGTRRCGPWCWRPRCRVWWPCRPRGCSGPTRHCWWSGRGRPDVPVGANVHVARTKSSFRSEPGTFWGTLYVWEMNSENPPITEAPPPRIREL